MTEENNQLAVENHPQPQQSLSIRESSINSVAAWLTAMNMPNVFNVDAPFVLVPKDIVERNVEPLMPRPARIRKDISFTDAASFLDYFNTFKPHQHPRLFVKGQDAGMTVLAIMDYALPPGKDHTSVPMWGDHRVSLALDYHPDYKMLRSKSGFGFTQDSFALFVEENTHLFVNPTGADMLELAQELKGVRNASWQSGKRLSNNQVKLEYIEQVEARGIKKDMVVPEYLEMSMPMFVGYDDQPIKAAFSWSMVADKVFFSFRLLTRVAERIAVDQVKASIVAETKMPLYGVSSFEGLFVGPGVRPSDIGED